MTSTVSSGHPLVSEDLQSLPSLVDDVLGPFVRHPQTLNLSELELAENSHASWQPLYDGSLAVHSPPSSHRCCQQQCVKRASSSESDPDNRRDTLHGRHPVAAASELIGRLRTHDDRKKATSDGQQSEDASSLRRRSSSRLHGTTAPHQQQGRPSEQWEEKDVHAQNRIPTEESIWPLLGATVCGQLT